MIAGGENRPYNVAVVILDVEAVGGWARDQGFTIERPTEDPRVKELIRNELTSRTADFNEFERPRRFVLSAEDFTVEN